jgi:hypothetical protein
MMKRLKRQRRTDPEVGSLTRLRDEIKARRSYVFDLPEPEAKAKPAYDHKSPQHARLALIRKRLREESMPTRERQCLQRLEERLADRLEE